MFVHLRLSAGQGKPRGFGPQKSSKLKVPRLFRIHSSPRRRRGRVFESVLELGRKFSYVPTFISHYSPSCV